MSSQCNINNTGSIACGTLVDKNCMPCDRDEEQLIEVKGVCTEEEITGLLENGLPTTWTQVFIPEVLCIPTKKPDIEQILSVTSKVEFISQRIVKTPAGPNGTKITNWEETSITGWKLVIEGILRQKIIYVADNERQSVHAAHFDVPFSTFIVLPTGTSLSDKFKVKACIEDIFVCSTTARQVFKNVTLFIKATKLNS